MARSSANVRVSTRAGARERARGHQTRRSHPHLPPPGNPGPATRRRGMMTGMAEATLTDVPPGHGVISKLTSDDGDFRLPWNPEDPDEVANARQAFRDLRAGGYAIYRITGGRRERREVITEFDPQAGQLVAVRPNRGG